MVAHNCCVYIINNIIVELDDIGVFLENVAEIRPIINNYIIAKKGGNCNGYDSRVLI